MKLQRKKTGEVENVHLDCGYGEAKINVMSRNGANYTKEEYGSLAELNEEWEDYEEPKDYWYIDSYGDVDYDTDNPRLDGSYSRLIEQRKEIGNYFETEEEAKAAIEKLKAWKRLRGRGFRFTGWSGGKVLFEIDDDAQDWSPDVIEDLNTLFGIEGEEGDE